MQKIKMALLITIIGILSVSCAVETESTVIQTKENPIGTQEVLLGIDIKPKTIELTVASGGCTYRNSFEVDVTESDANSPKIVTFRRIKPDNCKAMLRNGVNVSFDRKELGLDGSIEFTIANKLGNTSNHR